MQDPHHSVNTTEFYYGNSWSAGPDLPGGRHGHGMVSYHYTKAFLFAGTNTNGEGPNGFSKSCYEYDFKAPDQHWVRKPDIPHTSVQSTAAVLR